KQRLEDNKTFIKVGNHMGLLKFIFHSKNQKVKNTSIIADVFEAICGAIYLDSGKNLELVEQKIINRFFTDWTQHLKESTNLQKNELLEFLQNKLKITPKVEYDYEKLGPDNEVLWKAKNPRILDNSNNIILELPKSLKSSVNKSKKEAEKELSALILKYLKQSEF
ncbi:MAG: ribonuclease III domain-containing protein, partial [Candidatus Hermodarchaeota archaeon]